MRTTTPAVDTRPSFFAFRPIRHASVFANILREKFGPGDEANCLVAVQWQNVRYMEVSAIGRVRFKERVPLYCKP